MHHTYINIHHVLYIESILQIFIGMYRYIGITIIRKNSVCIVSRVLTQHVQLIKYLCRAIEIRLAINNNKNHLLPPIVSLNIKRINLE